MQVGESGKKGGGVGILKKPFFRGQSDNRLDAKGRLRIPAKYREVLREYYTDALIITRRDVCLVAYPPEIWELIEEKASELSQVSPESHAFIRMQISHAEECEFDNKGRVLIPPGLRAEARLSTDVVLLGALKGFEIWDKGIWHKYKQEMAEKENYQRYTDYAASFGL